MRSPFRRARTVLLAALLLAGTARAQEKSLHWSDLAVRARLDAEGILHVEERQVMVFTGDIDERLELLARVAAAVAFFLDQVDDTHADSLSSSHARVACMTGSPPRV